MEWSLDKHKAWTREIWPSEPAGALGTAATAKALRGSGGLPKQSVSWKSHRGPARGGPTEDSREYYRGGVVSLPTPKCPG